MNKNVYNIIPLINPSHIKDDIKIDELNYNFVIDTREIIQDIIDKKNNKLLVIIGPCSIHDYDVAIEYASFIKEQRVLYKDTLEIVMRTYFSKPRTTIGWKGLIYDPDINNTFDIERGLKLSRKLLIDIIKMGVPTSMEHVDTIFPQYFDDLISWSAIGARSVESQIHRELASGISTPLGFKNNTDGNIDVAINAITTANQSHSFIGCDEYGKVSKIMTNGNNHCNIILRGGIKPNYDEESVKSTIDKLKKKDLNSTVIIDCSHGNCQKVYKNQINVCECVCNQIENKNVDIVGIMIESNLVEGSQSINCNIEECDKEKLVYGQSITDGCINLIDSANLLKQLNDSIIKRNN